jgi:hypothetical protein
MRTPFSVTQGEHSQRSHRKETRLILKNVELARFIVREMSLLPSWELLAQGKVPSFLHVPAKMFKLDMA